MRVLVTGVPGRVGSAVTAAVPVDATVEVLVDPVAQHVPDFGWYRTDITDREKVLRTFDCADPGAVVHCAAMTDVDGCERNPGRAEAVNRDGAANVAEACAQLGAKLVFLSTDYVYDGRRGPYEEYDDPNPVNVYGATKLAGEQAVLERCSDSVILRISVPFGARTPGTDHNFVSWLIEELTAGRSVRVVTDQYTTPAFLDELAEIIWMVARNETSGILHYGTGNRLSRYDMALDLCRIMGYREELVIPFKTADLGLAAQRPLESGFVPDRIIDILGRPPILFRNALYRIAELTD